MTLPVLAKTWQFSINNIAQPATTLLAQTRALVFAIKQSLKGFALSAWTVWGSCDGTGVGSFGNGDSVDRWVDTGDLVWAAAGSNHSWIVLTQAGISAKCAICIDLNHATSSNASVIFSPSAGFGTANGGADGTATARPTASDEIVLVSATNYGAPSTISTRAIMHAMQSTDGKGTRILICVDGIVIGFWMIEVPASAPAAWTPLVFATVSASTTNRLTYTNLSNSGSAVFQAKLGAATIGLTSVFELPYSTAVPVQTMQFGPDDQSKESPFLGIGLYCITVGHRGHKGRIVDLWMNNEPATTGDAGAVYGHPYLDDGTYQFINIGSLIFPWNGNSVVLLA